MTRAARAAGAALAAGSLLAAACSATVPPRPPRLYRELVSGAGAGPGEPSGRGVADRGWGEELARLADLEAAWEADDRPRRAPERDGGAVAEPAALAAGFSLAELERLALERSPAVAEAESEFRAARTGFRQVAALDEVLRRYAAVAGGGMGDGPDAASRFPAPGRLALKGRIADAAVAEARAGLDRARREARFEAHRLFWELVLAERAAEIDARLLDLAAAAAAAARSRYESGQGTFREVVRSEADAARARTGLESARQARGVVAARIRALVLLPAEAAIGAPGASEDPPGTADREALVGRALVRRQELVALRAAVARAELLVAMAEREAYPGFASGRSLPGGLAVSPDDDASRLGGFMTGEPAGTGEGAPRRPWFGAEAAFIDELRHRAAALRSRLRAEEERTAADVQEAWYELDRAAREERLWEAGVGNLARLESGAAERGYAAGQETLTRVLESEMALRTAEFETARRRSARGIARAALERVVGAPLDADGAGAPVVEPAGGRR